MAHETITARDVPPHPLIVKADAIRTGRPRELMPVKCNGPQAPSNLKTPTFSRFGRSPQLSGTCKGRAVQRFSFSSPSRAWEVKNGLFVSGGLILEGREIVSVDILVESECEFRIAEDTKGFGGLICCSKVVLLREGLLALMDFTISVPHKKPNRTKRISIGMAET